MAEKVEYELVSSLLGDMAHWRVKDNYASLCGRASTWGRDAKGLKVCRMCRKKLDKMQEAS